MHNPLNGWPVGRKVENLKSNATASTGENQTRAPGLTCYFLHSTQSDTMAENLLNHKAAEP